MTEQQLDKLSRTDLIKMISQEVLEQLKTEVADCEAELQRARVAFETAVRDAAVESHAELLSVLADVCRFKEDDVVATVPRAIYREQPLPREVMCILSNSALPFEQRMNIEVRVSIESTGTTAHELKQALYWLQRAEDRDSKVTTVKESVRKDLVADLLKSGGEDADTILAASKRLAKAVKQKLGG